MIGFEILLAILQYFQGIFLQHFLNFSVLYRSIRYGRSHRVKKKRKLRERLEKTEDGGTEVVAYIHRDTRYKRYKFNIASEPYSRVYYFFLVPMNARIVGLSRNKYKSSKSFPSKELTENKTKQIVSEQQDRVDSSASSRTREE